MNENKYKKNLYGVLNIKYYDFFLKSMKKSISILLRSQLDKSTALGLSVSENPPALLKWWLVEKSKFPTCIIAIQVGNFIEFKGIDALMACEFAGLNPHGGKNPQMICGTNIVSIQKTLDSLIEQNFIVRVYKQVEIQNKFKTKERILDQVVSRSNPVYYNDIQNINGGIYSKTDKIKPVFFYVGDKELYVIYIPSVSYLKYEGIDECAFMAMFRSLDPTTVYHNSYKSEYIKNIPLVQKHEVHYSISSLEHILKYIKDVYGLSNDITFEQIFASFSPMLKSTSDQLGIRSSIQNIPDLVEHVIGDVSPPEYKFMADWLVLKPEEKNRTNMIRLCENINSGNLIIPRLPVLDPDRTFGFMLSDSAYKDKKFLFKIDEMLKNRVCDKSLFDITLKYTGISENYITYRKNLNNIEHLFATKLKRQINEEHIFEYIPTDIIKNELYIIDSPTSTNELKKKKTILNNMIAEFQQSKLDIKSDKDGRIFIKHNIENQAFTTISGTRHEAIPFKNNKGILKKNCWTTRALDHCLSEYYVSLTSHNREQKNKIIDFCKQIATLFGTSIKLLLHSQVICKSLHSHLSEVIKKGWTAPNFTHNDEIKISMLFPYWKSKYDSVTNDIELYPGEINLLTAPNGYGKTTLIRSLSTCAVLAYAGLFVPANSAIFSEIDNFCVRLPGTDRPDEGLSSFESEIVDLTHILKLANHKSLICLDEIVRSTSPKEGEAIATSILEFLAEKKCYCVFSTHMFNLLNINIPKRFITISRKHRWIRGCVHNSKAINTCIKHKLPKSIIQRSIQLLGCDNKTEIKKNIKCKKRKIQQISQNIIGTEAIHVNKNDLVPPFLNQKHCVYIIFEDGNEEVFYCGETKQIAKRYDQHKRTREGDMLVFPVDNKTDGMRFETLIQKSCIRENIKLSSVADSLHQL